MKSDASQSNKLQCQNNQINTSKSALAAAVWSSVLFVPLTILSCTTSKSGSNQTASVSEVIAPNADIAADQLSDDLPPELKDASRFDPAVTLDPKAVQESDFYQIKQSIDQNRDALEAGWREQERMENSVKAASSAEEQRNAAAAKADQEERERRRLKQIEAFEKSKAQREKDEQKANKAAEKLPSIKSDEVNWKGLED
jgi:hypothetical protein